jgi:DNA transposition AAA+ family ATPase
MSKDINKALEQDALVLRGERIPMADKQQQAAEALNKFMEERGLTNTHVARAIDVSGSVISQFKRGLYPGDIEQLVNKIYNYMESTRRREESGANEKFIDTSVALKIKALISHVDKYSVTEAKIGLVIGDAGCGKSCCLEQYAQANRNALYVQLDRTMNATRIFSAIAKKLKLDSSGSLAAVAERIIDALEGRQMIIILDEASYLNVSMLDQLRQIIVVKGKCPLIFAGNNDLLATITQSTTRRGYESLDQFNSRLLQVLDIDRLAADPKGGIYTAADIKKLYQYGGISLATDAVKRLRQIARAPKMGRLRSCTTIIVALQTWCKANDRDLITRDLIDAAIHELGLPIKNKLPALPEDDMQDERASAVA